jgi:hypothetical protein
MGFKGGTWGRRTVRAIAIMNILLAGFGGYVAAIGAGHIIPRLHSSATTPYVRQVYFISTFLDAGCLVMLVVGAVHLLRLNRLGLRICNFVFAIEIAWFLGFALTPLVLGMLGRWPLLGRSIATALGIGALGTEPQFMIGYPVLALIFLNLARGGFLDSAPNPGKNTPSKNGTL